MGSIFLLFFLFIFFFNDTATTEIYTLSLHDALPISDHLVRAYHKTFGLPVTITNCSNNYGSYQNIEKFIPVVITKLLRGDKVPVYGDGLNVRDWLYVDDHCRAIDLALDKGREGETYCVGGMTDEVSNIEIVKKIAQILGKEIGRASCRERV